MDRCSDEQRGDEHEGAKANLRSKRVREVFKNLPEWAPKVETSPTEAAVLSPDVTLNAFVQLVALRLGVDRSLISFLDGEEQYVLAEATKTSSLQPGRSAKEDDDLLTGVRTIPSRDGLCYEALKQTPADGILVIEDIHENQEFCLRPFTQSAPDIRFYAASPIVINSEKVGIVCVLDKNLRPAFIPDEVKFLSDITSAIAQYLGSIRTKRSLTRSEGIVAALDAVMRPGQRRSSLKASSTNEKISNPGRPQGESQDVESMDGIFSQLSDPEHTKPARLDASFTSSSEFLEYAGSLLVDGFNADGVVFYDAGSRVYTTGISRRNTGFSASSLAMLAGSQDSDFLGHQYQVRQAADSPACEILAFCNGSRSHNEISDSVGLLQEQELRYLLELYPAGEILHVSSIETPKSNMVDGSQGQIPVPSDRTGVDQCLMKAMPDAQSIAFFPLWDHGRERWYAGGFLYSNDAKQVMFTEEDLSFLRTFSLALTGELSSREQERSHSQKETFISMISHELRTPLHGILSNVDLMKDIGLTTFQTTLLDTISACGHSLMDIINHLIDRSTLGPADENFKKHHQLSRRHQIAPLRRATSYDKSEEVDLVVVTEEVISALAAEMHLKAEARQGYEAALQSSNSSEAQDLLPSYAVVVYDIHPHHNWFVRIRKGAFRRLLANLASNAIKFTRDGTIQISLQRRDPTDDKATCTVVLEVEDTGEGISSDFLKHHLFQQFQQENSHTIGSGLGLYIAKSMANELHGKIDVRSSKGNGTLVSVEFPCELVEPSQGAEDVASMNYADSIMQQVKTEAHRLTACFVGSKDGERPAQNNGALQHSKDSLSRICRNWFDIEIESTTKLKAGPGIINIVDESFLDSRSFIDVLADMARDLKWTESGKTRTSPVIFVGTVNFTAALQRQPKFEAKEYMFSITNPCGPHQFARVFASCMSLILTNFEPEQTLPQVESGMKGLTLSQSPQELQTDQNQNGAASTAQIQPTDISAAAEPAMKQSDTKDSIIHPSIASPWKRKPYMLLVEDNAINMKVLERLCHRLSLSYALAFNGLDAVKLFETSSSKFDIVWMDIMMPIMDGITATKQIRDIEKTAGRNEVQDRARVVALTGLSGKDIESDAEGVGFDAFWTKPVKLDLLKKEVDRWAQLQEEYGG